MGENFDINNFDARDNNENIGELNMSVSAICSNKNNEKYAYVTFSDGIREAEGIIPKCRIMRNQGFAEIEIHQLEKYMQENLQQLKQMAKGVDIFSAFLANDESKN